MLGRVRHETWTPWRSTLGVALLACLVAAGGCGGGAGGGGGGHGASGGGGSTPSSSATGSTSSGAGSCDPDTLKTGLPVLFNGDSVDSADCPILEFTAKYGEPDAMIFKAIIYVESRFQYDAVGCTGNSGCCPQYGWAGEECGCLGLMQTGPVCGSSNGLGLLPNGHP
ncbi:MAG TPA: hypothetical protein VHB21_24825, partial [Minicystis sp.]|nr:hypothetical protein [Minicystis sp.]